MATYRLEAKIIGRAAGRSVVAAAAYRSGEQLVDHATGRSFDYTRRHGVDASEILTPEGAAFASREQLWNIVEQTERRCDAQLAREFIVSLPHELESSERRELVRSFVREEFLSLGLVADVSIHRPDSRGDERNHHAHILVTTRPLTPAGFGPKLRTINTRAQLRLWRERWEAHVNRALERANVRARVDHRSLRAQGLDSEPEPKQGPFATELERRGRRTFAGDERRTVRARNEAREQRRRAERARSLRPAALNQIIDAALEALSPLIDSFTAASVGRGRGRRSEAPSLEHPGHDRAKEWQAQLLSQHYGREILSSTLAQRWSVQRTENGIVFRNGASRLADAGSRISINGEAAKDVAAMLDLAERKGWTAIKVERGSATFKVAVMAAALQRGLDVVARGDDRQILAELRRLHAQSERARTAHPLDHDPAMPAAGAHHAESSDVAPDVPPAAAPRTQDVVVSETLQLLTQQNSTFTRKDLEKTLERFCASPEHLAELLVAAQTHPDVIHAGVDDRGVERFTTASLYATEERLLSQSLEMATSAGFAVPDRIAQKILRDRGLTPQQAEALQKCAAPNRFVAIVGLAGTGKSFLMKAYVDALKEAGYDVVCGALAGVPTDSLARDAGIADARTIAGWRVWLDSGNAFSAKTVFIGDEWGMVGSEDAAAITRALCDVGAKQIAIGDFLQLQPIAAGAPFRAVVERLPAENVARLDDVRRQEAEWMREATKLFGNGQPREALQLYEQHGRFVGHETREDAKREIAAAWLETHLEHPDKSQLILTYTRADTLDVNVQLRALKREHGELQGPDVTYKTSDGERAFAVNDRVFFTHPENRTLGVRNGTRAIVTAVDPEAKTLTLRIPEQEDRSLTVTMSEYNAIDYSDCCTTHKAQGQTVDVSHFLASSHRGLAMYLTYVAMSRHRQDAHLHWSKDQFKGVSQVYRVLSRVQPKDYTLDYSAQGAPNGFGQGIPHQGPASIAMRATHQIRAELRHVLYTAAHLRDTAAQELRAQAQRAYGAVTSWYSRIDEQLRELESRGIRGVVVTGTANTFHDRLTLLEQSVATALERALGAVREPVRNVAREDVQRRLATVCETLRARLDEIRAALDNRVAPLPAPDAVVASELHRLEQVAHSAGNAAARQSAEADLEAARARFARPDVLDAMWAAHRERAALVVEHVEIEQELRAERDELRMTLQRAASLERRLQQGVDRDFPDPAILELDGVDLVRSVEANLPADAAAGPSRDEPDRTR
ncbi:hypothetical protein EPN44_14370 [bacterium]|nr:MAG: hypothetical protein EPN44_14370 [bacterium]